MKNDIASFIKTHMQIYRQSFGGKGQLRFQLFHVGLLKGKETLETVSSWNLDPAANLQELSTEIYRLSEADAEDYGGPQKYLLKAEAHVQSKEDESEEEDENDDEEVDVQVKVLGRMKWRVSASENELLDFAGPSEPATEDGQIAQQMRHAEYMVKRVAKSADLMDPVIRSYQKELERKDLREDKLQQRIELLEAKLSGSIELREQLATKEHERALELAEFQGGQEFRARGMQMIAPLIPILLAKFTGQKSVGGQMSLALNGLLDTIDEKQFTELTKVFRPEQLSALMMIWEETKKTANEASAPH